MACTAGSSQGVGQRYLEQLVEEQRYARAAEVCLAVLGTERQLWEAEVFRFAQLHQLRALAPVLPRGPHRLGPTAYEMVLNEFLQLDPQVRPLATLIAFVGKPRKLSSKNLAEANQAIRHVGLVSKTFLFGEAATR